MKDNIGMWYFDLQKIIGFVERFSPDYKESWLEKNMLKVVFRDGKQMPDVIVSWTVINNEKDNTFKFIKYNDDGIAISEEVLHPKSIEELKKTIEKFIEDSDSMMIMPKVKKYEDIIIDEWHKIKWKITKNMVNLIKEWRNLR
jgi:hypothetical protein